MRPKSFLRVWCIRHKPCNIFLEYGALGTNHTHYLQTDQSEISDDKHHLRVLSGASKLIFMHMVCSMQTMHLPCISIRTVSKLTEPSFHLSLFTQEYQIVRLWFLRLWCIRRELCIYPALKLILSPNGLN